MNLRPNVYYLIIILGLSLYSFSSCQINVNAPPFKQSFWSYYKQSKAKAPDLFITMEDDACPLRSNEFELVYRISGPQLKNCLENETWALVYFWQPNCSSSVCISPTIAQSISDRNQIALYVVAEYYDVPKMSYPYTTKRPLFGMNTKHYGTDLQRNYIKLFYKDITGLKYSPESGSFFLFRQGDYQGSYRTIDSLISGFNPE